MRRNWDEPVKPPPGFTYYGTSQQIVYRPKETSKDSLEEIAKIYAQDHHRTAQTLDPLSTVAPTPFYDTVKQESRSQSPEPLATVDGHTANWATEESEYVQVERGASPENTSFESPHHHRPISPSKDDFHYGGFVESPTQQATSNNSQTSSPFCKWRKTGS
jgi:hypothetical protein